LLLAASITSSGSCKECRRWARRCRRTPTAVQSGRDDSVVVGRTAGQGTRRTRRMRGAVLLGERQIEVRDFPDPTPGEGEVVLEMKASGICGSDLKRYRGPASDRPKAELK